MGILCAFTGKKLSDLERVTSLKVYNWFANRRKEIKRRANIGNVSEGLFPLVECFINILFISRDYKSE